MTALLASLLGSRAGRYLALGLLVAAGLYLAWRYVRASGAEAERLKQLSRTVAVIEDKVRHDAEIRDLPADERRRRLREWARDAR